MDRINKYFINTPVEDYGDYFVKREDMACLPPGPPFAKPRGLFSALKKYSRKGVKHIGYFETSVSMATYALSYFSNIFGIKTIVYIYEYKERNLHNRRKQRKIWRKYNCELRIIKKANLMRVQNIIARKLFYEEFPTGVFIEPGLKFKETLIEISKQVKTLPPKALGGSIIVSVGSGQMLSGIVKGIKDLNIEQDIYGVFVHPKNEDRVRREILNSSGINNKINLNLIDIGFQYTKKEKIETPFPCCPYYDKKAFRFMRDNINRLKKPILFWNIGGPFKIKG